MKVYEPLIIFVSRQTIKKNDKLEKIVIIIREYTVLFMFQVVVLTLFTIFDQGRKRFVRLGDRGFNRNW